MSDDSLLADLRALERALHDPAIRRDPARLEALLAEDFSEIGASGARYADRAAMITLLLAEKRPRSTTLESSDFRLKRLADGVVLLTYETLERALDGSIERRVRRSSLWRKAQLGWQIVFHQGTPVPSVPFSNPPA